jgi:hypothetical protein
MSLTYSKSKGSRPPQLAQSSPKIEATHITCSSIPEPIGEVCVILPISDAVKNLLNIEYIGETCKEVRDTLWRHLRQGEILHQGIHNSRWIIKISDVLVVKCGPAVDICELQTLDCLSPFREQIPSPESFGALSIGTWHYLFMSYVEGTPLVKVWPELSSELKASVQSQLEQIICHLRKIPIPSEYIGSGSPPRCKDLRRLLRIAESEIKSEVDFNTFLTRTNRKFNPAYFELATANLSTSHQVVMTHSDLHPRNILVQRDSMHRVKVTGIVDWELSGAYPEYWEYVKALAGVNCDLSDWYSYLPVAAIGCYKDAWVQDCFATKLIL